MVWITRVKNGAIVSEFDINNIESEVNKRLIIERRLRPSQLIEYIEFSKSGNIYFSLGYGEATILRIKMGKIPKKSLKIMTKRIINLIKKRSRRLEKRVDYLFDKYEKKFLDYICKA